MRSRDGSYHLIFTVSLIVSLNLDAKQYQIGYRFSTHNATIYSETLHIAPAMRDCKIKINPDILTIDRDDTQTIESLLEKNKNIFIEHFGKYHTHIKSEDFIKHNYINQKNTLTIPTKCYEIELNDNFATITLLN